MTSLQLIGITGLPLIETGDDLPLLIANAMKRMSISLTAGDILVVTSKIVSKAEGRWANLEEVVVSEHAQSIARQCLKDPREVEIILSESTEISRLRPGVLIVRHRLGFVCANAGIDHSNTRPDENWRLLLPLDPDRSARLLRDKIGASTGVYPGIVIADSHGRPFRLGTVGVAVGVAGIPALVDWRGLPDLFDRQLRVTQVGLADEIAAAAGLVLGQSNQSTPVVLVRGLSISENLTASATDLMRSQDEDLYR
jgi:coenzyme F420-0:L-glutamate ligase/coenzyme F420-1:gamma-L-glutamate ligase